MPKKSKLATSYWEKRRQLEDAARLKMENETIKELTSIFPDALKQIQEILLSQADLHDISLQDLLALPTKRTQEEYRKYIDARYQELMESDDAYQEFIDEFFPAYDYAKLNRLTQIRADIFSIMTAEMMKKDVNQKFNDRLEDILQRSYSSNANALTYLLGGDFHQLPKRELEKMLTYPWTGKTFSQRLWGNVSKLEERLSNAIVNSVGAGKGMRDILATMKNDPQVSALFKREEDKFDNAIENLVRTEYAHFAVEGIKKSFKDTGVKKAVSWSAEDERVCSICGGMHGKEVKENESGPPYHGRCRCTLMPKMPELDTAAIDAEYEALFGNTLNEFAKDGFGVKLSHPKKTVYNKDDELANVLNVKRGEPMTIEEADDSNANPHYKEGKNYQINCQRCVPAYELRRRGFNVEALSAADGSIWGNGNSMVVFYGSGGMRIPKTFIDPESKEYELSTLIGKRTMKQVYKKLEETVKNDERYFLAMEWAQGGAHIVNMEKIDGVLSIVDSQSGEILPIDKYFSYYKAKPSSLNYCRIDNLDINLGLINKLVKAKDGGEQK